MKTIEEIIIYLTKSDPKTPVELEKKTSEPEIESNEESNNANIDKKLTRQVVSLKEYPTNQIRFYNGAKIELPAKKKVYITKDNSEIAARFKTEFKKLGIDADLIDISKGNIPELPDAAGLVLVPDAFRKKKPGYFLKFFKIRIPAGKKECTLSHGFRYKKRCISINRLLFRWQIWIYRKAF